MDDRAALEASGLWDAAWYARTYPDVALSGLDPAEHFLRLGRLLRRDPSPRFSTAWALDTDARRRASPRPPVLAPAGPLEGAAVPQAAWRLAREGQDGRALALLEAHLPAERAAVAHVLRADAAARRGREAEWLAALNLYLGRAGLAPLVLEGQGPLVARLSTAPLPEARGPLVSVLMAAFDAEATVEAAARSVLRQTWRDLELIVVDDASRDGTGEALRRLAAEDPRLRVRRNRVNVGPYVSRNLALGEARGAWVTGQDADDWSHPQRLEQHMGLALRRRLRASLGHMLRMTPEGAFGHVSAVGPYAPDGVARRSMISCLYEARLLRETLGFWDSVRFGADSEMAARAEAALGRPLPALPLVGMLCLDHPRSLTNHPESGVRKDGGLSAAREAYRRSWRAALAAGPGPGGLFLPLVQEPRRHAADPAMTVDPADVRANLGP